MYFISSLLTHMTHDRNILVFCHYPNMTPKNKYHSCITYGICRSRWTNTINIYQHYWSIITIVLQVLQVHSTSSPLTHSSPHEERMDVFVHHPWACWRPDVHVCHLVKRRALTRHFARKGWVFGGMSNKQMWYKRD